MNATFLLVTTAWLAGADGHQAPGCNSCGSAPCTTCTTSCSDCCEKEGLFSKMKNKFRRSDDCCDPCGAEKPTLLSRLRDKLRKDDCCNTCSTPCTTCAPVTTCHTCATECRTSCDSCRSSLFSRMRDKFRKKSDCCDSCSSCGSTCNGCGTVHPGATYPGGVHTGPTTMPKADGAEKLPAPEPGKKMPTGDKQTNFQAPAFNTTPTAAPRALDLGKSPY